MKKLSNIPILEDEVLEKELWLNPFFLITLWIILMWIIFWLIIYLWINTWSDRWTFWDMFWAINALFSWIALAGVIYTMLLQRQELKYQREELIKNREELKRTAQAQENQAETQKISAKLNAMSTLINYHLSNISRMPNWTHWNDAMKVNSYKGEIEKILEKEF